MDSRVLHSISYGVYIISTYDQGNSRHTGCVANSVMQVTSSPATLAVSINRQNHTHACINESGMFSVAVLSEKTDPALIGAFGFASGRDKGKYDGIAHTVEEGIARPDDCCGYMLCKVVDRLEAGSHTVFLAKVLEGRVLSADAPMTYSFYHKVIKGRTAKNAPTYIEEEAPAAAEPKAAGGWRCTVCGFEYTGQPPFEQLPEDYTCPICGVPKAKFLPI